MSKHMYKLVENAEFFSPAWPEWNSNQAALASAIFKDLVKSINPHSRPSHVREKMPHISHTLSTINQRCSVPDLLINQNWTPGIKNVYSAPQEKKEVFFQVEELSGKYSYENLITNGYFISPK